MTSEIERLDDKLTRMDAWLCAARNTHPKHHERQDLWFRILHKYERLYDAEMGATRQHALVMDDTARRNGVIS